MRTSDDEYRYACALSLLRNLDRIDSSQWFALQMLEPALRLIEEEGGYEAVKKKMAQIVADAEAEAAALKRVPKKFRRDVDGIRNGLPAELA